MLCGLIVSQAQNYYVGGANASNSNPGTAALPYATIGQAASVAGPGSTIYIRTGTYRETIAPAVSGTSGNPITFKPDGSSLVSISGLNVVDSTGWSVYIGSIYQKTIPLPSTGTPGFGSAGQADQANAAMTNTTLLKHAPGTLANKQCRRNLSGIIYISQFHTYSHQKTDPSYSFVIKRIFQLAYFIYY